MMIMNKKKIIGTLVTCTLLVLIISCSKENNFIPLYINNIKIEEIDKQDYDLVFKAAYKDTQTLECIIDNYFLVADELKITGTGASFYDGKINLYVTTNNAWIDEDFIFVPYRISFELSGAGLNRRKCDIELTLNGSIRTFEIN